MLRAKRVQRSHHGPNRKKRIFIKIAIDENENSRKFLQQLEKIEMKGRGRGRERLGKKQLNFHIVIGVRCACGCESMWSRRI